MHSLFSMTQFEQNVIARKRKELIKNIVATLLKKFDSYPQISENKKVLLRLPYAYGIRFETCQQVAEKKFLMDVILPSYKLDKIFIDATLPEINAYREDGEPLKFDLLQKINDNMHLLLGDYQPLDFMLDKRFSLK